MSQTLLQDAKAAGRPRLSCFVKLRETETEREQPVLLPHRSGVMRDNQDDGGPSMRMRGQARFL